MSQSPLRIVLVQMPGQAPHPVLHSLARDRSFKDLVRVEAVPELHAALDANPDLILLAPGVIHGERNAAEEVNRAKDEFVTLVCHELRGPLNAITIGLTLLRKVCDESSLAILDTVERSAQLQARLVDDLFDLSRIGRGTLAIERVPTGLDQAVAHALEAVRPEAERAGLTLLSRIEPDLTVLGDHDRLQQVAANLLNNAIKFTPEGGTVTAVAERVESATAPLARLVVEDTGIGITPELLPRMFDLYRQGEATNFHASGLGLGLALVKAIVERHDGTIRAESAGSGKGSRFVVELPFYTEA